MSVYSYDSAVARDSEAGLARTASSLEAALADLSGFVAKVCANWEGDEQVVYKGIQTQWDTAAAELHATLTQIKTRLGNTPSSVDAMRTRAQGALRSS